MVDGADTVTILYSNELSGLEEDTEPTLASCPFAPAPLNASAEPLANTAIQYGLNFSLD